MKYVFLGTLNPEWIGAQKERVDNSKAMASKLGVTFDAIYYVQGYYDFLDIVEASDASGVLAFSAWYAKQGYGRITTLPLFDEAAMEAAVAKAS